MTTENIKELSEKLADQADTIAHLQADNARMRKTLVWALGCLDIGSWITDGDMKPAVDAYYKAKEALGETK